MCCTRLAGNAGPKKSPKIRNLCTIAFAQFCRAISSQLRRVSTIGKNLLNSNTSSTCTHNMANFSPLTAEIGLPVWGTPANFNGFRVLAALLHVTPVVLPTSQLSSGWHHIAREAYDNNNNPSSGRQPIFAALNREHHLYSAGRPWRLALAHILVIISVSSWLEF